MINPLQFLAPYEAASYGNQVIAPACFVDEHSYLTKTGSIGVTFSVPGIEYECLTESQLKTASEGLSQVFSILDDSFRVYQHLFKRRRADLPESERYRTPVVARTVQSRNRFLEDRGLYSIDLFLTVLYEPAGFTRKWLFSNSEALRVLASKLQEDCARLKQKRDAVHNGSRSILHPRLLEKQEVFSFLRRLVNLDSQAPKELPLCADDYLDEQLLDQAIFVHRGGIQIGERPLEVLTVQETPRKTSPNLFAALYALPGEFCLCTEWKPTSSRDATSIIESAKTHYNQLRFLKNPLATLLEVFARIWGGGAEEDVKDTPPDQACIDNLAELAQLSGALNRGDGLGEFSITALLYGENRKALAAEVIQIFGRYEGKMAVESYNALNAYLGIIPGNPGFNMRRYYMLRSSMADMSLAYRLSQGSPKNEFLNDEYLFVTSRNDGTPYFVNLHYSDTSSGAAVHLGVSNLFIMGLMGVGKSVLSNAYLDHLQKYNPLTCILDVGHSYRNLCRKYDGAYMHLELAKQEWRCNPFVLPFNRDNVEFLHAFLILLLKSNHYPVTYQDERALFHAINELYTEDEEHRRISNLKLPPGLKDGLGSWMQGEQYGTLFDNVEDTITLADFQVFDFQGIKKYTKVMQPLLFYIFQRQSAQVQNPKLATRPKMLWADELWTFLSKEAACKEQFIANGKESRKHNGGIGLTTQSAGDLKKARVLEIVKELCPIQIFLSNPKANVPLYQRNFGWNDTEAALFPHLIPRKQYMEKRGNEPVRIVNFDVDPVALAMTGNDVFGNVRRDAAIAEHGFTKGLEVAAAQTV